MGLLLNLPGDTRKQSYFFVNYKPLDTAALIGYDKVNPASLFSYNVQRQKNQICPTVGVGYRMIFSSYWITPPPPPPPSHYTVFRKMCGFQNVDRIQECNGGPTNL